MDLKFLALSDTHLGEPTSLLTYGPGVLRFGQALMDHFGDGQKFTVDELVLIGDIPDRCLAATDQIKVATPALIDRLMYVCQPRKIVYLPGNHDHTLWQSFYAGHAGTDADELPLIPKDPSASSSAEVIDLFFHHKDGHVAVRPEQMTYANPIYVREFAGRIYVFTHGTLFKKTVVDRENRTCLAAAARAISLHVDASHDLSGNMKISELEKAASYFVDSLWVSAGNDPTPPEDHVWHVVECFEGWRDRAAPTNNGTGVLHRLVNNKLVAVGGQNTVAKIEAKDDSYRLWNKYFAAPLARYLQAPGQVVPSNVTFVFGDTHNGGFGNLAVRFYNTGSWTTRHHNHHPECHVFAVDQTGQEMMLDVSFANVKVDQIDLVTLAAKDAEARMERAKSLKWYVDPSK